METAVERISKKYVMVDGSLQRRRVEQLVADPKPVLEKLRELAWGGLPDDISWSDRSLTWRLLLKIVPTDIAARPDAMEEKTQLYRSLAATTFSEFVNIEDEELRYSSDSTPSSGKMSESSSQLKQIRADVMRTRPDFCPRLFEDKRVQLILTRCLFLWACKHPASGYVQGINDILAPFFTVFVLAKLHPENLERDVIDPSNIPSALLLEAEVESHYALQSILLELQDFYVSSQPGIQKLLDKLERYMTRINGNLVKHFRKIGVTLDSFAFRWYNCLMIREFRGESVFKLFDTYISEGPKNLRNFLLFLSIALLARLAPQLVHADFSQTMMIVQAPPTHKELNTPNMCKEMISEAFVWKSLFEEYTL